MKHKFELSLLCAGFGLLTPIMAPAAAPPECTPAQLTGLPEANSASYTYPGGGPDQLKSAFADLAAKAKTKRPDGELDGVITGEELYYPFGALERYGFRLKLVVGVDGRISCASLLPLFDGEPQPEWTPQRRELAELLPKWRFMPYLSGGRPVPVIAVTRVMEYEMPQTHVPMPAGDTSQVVIIQDMPYFGYHLELHGNGDAVISWSRPDFPSGPVHYHVDPSDVAHILKEAEDTDFWSLRDVYPQTPKTPGDYASRIEITLGGVTKSVTDYDDPESGMPRDGHFLAWAIRHDVPMGPGAQRE